MSFDNIPDELKQYRQWLNWKHATVNGKLTKVPVRSVDGYNASVTNPLDWNSFDTAVSSAYKNNVGIGFVFTKSDPFVGIDLDDPAGNLEVITRYNELISGFSSYAETSPSGNGVHIIVRGRLDTPGKRRSGIELYDAERYFTFTGNAINNYGIAEAPEQLAELHRSLSVSNIVETTVSGNDAEPCDDATVIDRASAALNGDKFKRLYAGDWKSDYGNKSQSEADFALVDILAFYTQNSTQIMRLFRASGLGKRPKALRGPYLGGMISRAFDKMPKQISITATPGQTWFDAREVAPWTRQDDATRAVVLAATPYEPEAWQPAPAAALARPAPVIVPVPTLIAPAPVASASGSVDYFATMPEPQRPMQIPGLFGELVNYCFDSAEWRIAEVSIASALATMSLLTSRTYRCGSLGLSLYVMMLAPTGTGKSFGYTAIDRWHNELLNRYRIPGDSNVQMKARREFLESMIFGKVGSAQGLAQHIQEAPACLMKADEYIGELREMAGNRLSPTQAQIRDELLKLVEHSGPGRIYNARKYSKRTSSDKEGKDVVSASLTVYASGTPGDFYENMSSELLTGGFIPRFVIMQYDGAISKPNFAANRTLAPEFVGRLKFLFDRAFDMNQKIENGVIDGGIDVKAADIDAENTLNAFSYRCVQEMEQANRFGLPTAGLWSRVKTHVLKIACLIAVGVNPHMPVYTTEHVNLAIAIVMPGFSRLVETVNRGGIGSGDDRREQEILTVMDKFSGEHGWGFISKWSYANPDIWRSGYVQLALLRNYCVKLSVFRNHPMQANRAFDDQISQMIKYGIITLVEFKIGDKTIKAIKLA